MSVLREDHEERIAVSIDSAFLKWRIQGFGRLAEEGGLAIKSRRFSCFDGIWSIIVKPKATDLDTLIDYIGILITCRNNSNCDINARLKVYLKDYKNKDHCLWDHEFTYEKETNSAENNFLVPTLEVLNEKRKELCPNDVLTLCFEISVVGDIYFSIVSCTSAPVKTGETSFFCYDEISETFSDMLKARKYSDLTVVSCGQKFAVHKAVLSAYSPVFARKLQRTTRSKASNIVEINNFDPSLVTDFIGFMYSGRVQEMTYEKAMNLLSLAEDYEVDSLKSSCTHYLSRIITLDNFASIMDTMHRTKHKHLLEALKKFFSSNFGKIILEGDWATLITRYPSIIAKLKKYHNLNVVESDSSSDDSPSDRSPSDHSPSDESLSDESPSDESPSDRSASSVDIY